MDRTEAQALASKELQRVERDGYGVASEHIEQVILKEITAPGGTDYELELSYLWDDEEHEDILVICRVKARTWFERGHVERSIKLACNRD